MPRDQLQRAQPTPGATSGRRCDGVAGDNAVIATIGSQRSSGRATRSTQPALLLALAVAATALDGTGARAATGARGQAGATARDRTGNGDAGRAAKARPLTWASRAAALRFQVHGAGWSLRDEHHPQAVPHQLVEAVEIVRNGDVLVRLDVFANPQRETAAEWLDGDQRPLGLGAKDVRPIAVPAGAPRGSSALRLHFEHASQSQARTLVLLTTPTMRLRLTCEDAEDHDALAAFAAALGGLSWPTNDARGGR